MNKNIQHALSQLASFFKAQTWPPSIQRPWLFWLGVILFCLGLLVASGVDRHEAKEWQTLLAAMIALLAAAIAYQGAMAKVNQDRQMKDEELLREKTGLYLRLQFSLQALETGLQQLEENTRWWVNPEKLDHKPIVDEVVPKIDNHPEINEAWEKLEYFSVPISRELHRVRLFLRFLSHLLAKKTNFVKGVPPQYICKAINDLTKDALPSCKKITDLIKAELGALPRPSGHGT